MNVDEKTQNLLELIDTSSSDAYMIMYEMVSSVLYELTTSWLNDFHDKTDKQLASSSRILKRICKRMDGAQYSLEYEAGRLSGVIESFEVLFRQEQESYAIDATLSELLSRSKPASKRVLQILFESQKDDCWVSNSELAAKCEQSPSALSNIMKRLVQVHAVDYFKEGRNISYRLTPAGKRYYEKNIKPSATNALAKDLDYLKEKSDNLHFLMMEVLQQQKRQTRSISNIEHGLPFYKSRDANASKNIILQYNDNNASTSKLDFSESSPGIESNATRESIA